MRIVLTADLHYDHAKSRPSADDMINQINQLGTDVLIVIGDAAASAGDALERCLSRFTHPGAKLFVPGNHELWSLEQPSYELFINLLPNRIRSLGWHWLESDPFPLENAAVVGTVGWYDYSFAQAHLGIPQRFYEHKISPGAAAMLSQFSHLLQRTDDIAPHAMELFARWNDGRFVRLGRSDEQFLEELLVKLRRHLEEASARSGHIIAVVHHLPFRELLPPSHSAQWDFSKAYLGSEKLGQLLLEFPQVHQVFCGHSHFPAEARLQHLLATNIGSGYREKAFKVVELPNRG